MRSRQVFIFCFLMLVPLLWPPPSSYVLAADDVIKIGTIYPKTGALATFGREAWRGSEVARMIQNDRGGLLGKKIEFINGDAPDPKAAVSETERLCTVEKVPAIIGTFVSGISLPASLKANQHKVVYWEGGGASADAVTQRGLKYVFRTSAPASAYGGSQVTFALDVITPRIGKTKENVRIANIYEDSGYGTAIAAGAREMAKSRGINFVADESYNYTTMDLSSLVMRLKDKKPDIILESSYENDGILFFRQAQELGLKFRMIIGTGAGLSQKGYRKALGDAVDHRVCNCSYPGFTLNPDYAKGIDTLASLYQKTFGEKAQSLCTPTAFMGTMVLWEIIKRAGSTDPEAIVKTANETEISEKDTVLRFGVKFAPPGSKNMGQNVLAGTFIEQWQGGNTYVVWPAQAALPGVALKIPESPGP